MSDPVVSSFITKLLCAHGGRLEYNFLPQQVQLSEQQLRQILEDAGQERFLIQKDGSSTWVLAVSSVRLCVRKECSGCDQLHLCKLNLMGRCRARTCKYSHEVFSEDNRKILKKHELSGLNESELHVLLLQNDPFLLPDVCGFHNRRDMYCVQQDKCTKLHICRYFLRGECRFPQCKRSHNLFQPNVVKLLLEGGVDSKVAWNIQTICSHKTAVLSRELGSSMGYSSNTRPTAGGENSSAGNQRENRREQAPDTSKFMNLNLGPDQGVKTTPYTKTPRNVEKEKSDEICLFYVWQFCKNKNNCSMIHYDLPYRWQIQTENGWKDLPKREEIEKAYSDPNITSILDPDINFKSMTSLFTPVRRLSTPSSVTKPAKFVMTTKWLWYWKNDLGQWIIYKQDGLHQGSTLSSDDLENLFLADPSGNIQFTAGSQQYEISFKAMTQRNVHYLTLREIRRRPKFVSTEDVKSKKGHMNDAATSAPTTTYPSNWDKSALPTVGYEAVELTRTSPEFIKIETLFKRTTIDCVIHKISRIQNPSLWQIFQWQKEQMKKKRGGQTVDERLLFHGTDSSSLEAICNENFDWRICGTNGTALGKGSYFARDAQYSHKYCQRDAKLKTMFVAQVLVGDFVIGNATYTRPPAKSTNAFNYYDSCVDKLVDPSIFVIFEKHQIYPAYLICYSEDKKCVLS